MNDIRKGRAVALALMEDALTNGLVRLAKLGVDVLIESAGAEVRFLTLVFVALPRLPVSQQCRQFFHVGGELAGGMHGNGKPLFQRNCIAATREVLGRAIIGNEP